MIVLHIGFPKAGSTTIQTFLEANQEQLRTLSIDYTRVGRRRQKAHHTLAFELKGWDARMNPKAGRLEDVARHVRRSGHATTILSSELFSDLKPRQIRHLAKELAPAEQPFRIILIMRDQLSAIVSLYGQKIRYGDKTFDFDEFFAGFTRSKKFDQYGIVERWADVFGWAAIKIRILERSLLTNGDLIDAFIQGIDVDPDSPQIGALSRPSNVNESAGWRTAEAVRALFGRQIILDTWPLLQKLSGTALGSSQRHLIGQTAEEVAGIFDWAKEKGLYLTRAQANICLDSYRASVQQLNRHLPEVIPDPPSLEARGFIERDFLPGASHISSSELNQFYCELEKRLSKKPELSEI